jgi:hypothetical protein
MHILIDRQKTLKNLQAQLTQRRKDHVLELRTFRVNAKTKALELLRKALQEIEAYDAEIEGRIPDAVTSPLPYELRHAPNPDLGNLEYAITVLQASCETQVKLNEKDSTSQTILRYTAKAA